MTTLILLFGGDEADTITIGKELSYKTGAAKPVLEKMAASAGMNPQELAEEIHSSGGWSNGYATLRPDEEGDEDGGEPDIVEESASR